MGVWVPSTCADDRRETARPRRFLFFVRGDGMKEKGKMRMNTITAIDNKKLKVFTLGPRLPTTIDLVA